MEKEVKVNNNMVQDNRQSVAIFTDSKKQQSNGRRYEQFVVMCTGYRKWVYYGTAEGTETADESKMTIVRTI